MTRSDAIYRTLAGLMDRDPADPEVQEAVDQWRQLIATILSLQPGNLPRPGRSLCGRSLYASIDKYGAGLARFMREAMHCYCDRQEEQGR